MRVHGEPQRVNSRPARCPSCGLPFEEAHRQRLEARCENTIGWAFCPECGCETCRELRRLCAEEIEAEAKGGG